MGGENEKAVSTVEQACPCGEVAGWTNPGHSPKIAPLLPGAATGGSRDFFRSPPFGPVVP